MVSLGETSYLLGEGALIGLTVESTWFAPVKLFPENDQEWMLALVLGTGGLVWTLCRERPWLNPPTFGVVKSYGPSWYCQAGQSTSNLLSFQDSGSVWAIKPKCVWFVSPGGLPNDYSWRNQ